MCPAPRARCQRSEAQPGRRSRSRLRLTTASPITGYTMTAHDKSDPTHATDGKTVSGSASPVVVDGLRNGDRYTFTVTAANQVGTGPASDSVRRGHARRCPRRAEPGVSCSRAAEGDGVVRSPGRQRQSDRFVHGDGAGQVGPGACQRRQDGERQREPGRRGRAAQRRPLHVHCDGHERGRDRACVGSVRRGHARRCPRRAGPGVCCSRAAEGDGLVRGPGRQRQSDLGLHGDRA